MAKKFSWKEALNWSEESIDDLRFIGYSYIKEGVYETALKIFKGLIVLSPDNLYDLQTLGALYLQKNQLLEALHFLDRALALDPAHLPTLLNRTKTLFMLGYEEQAMKTAIALQKCKDPEIANQAAALIYVRRAPPL